MRTFQTVLGASLVLAMACNSADSDKQKVTNPQDVVEYVKDPHSHADPTQTATNHLFLDIDVNFDRKLIRGVARYDIVRQPGAKELILDTRDLVIQGVKDQDARDLVFELKEEDELGSALVVQLNKNTNQVAIAYHTGPSPAALQWLSPEQTSSKKHPFLFTQGQAILTRSWLPLQDSPGVRFTYDAKVQVPKDLLAIMSATNPTQKSETGRYEFSMKQPIPGYLMALAVGDIEFRSVGPRTGVYAEPALVEKAAYEFGDMEQMLAAAEGLYGDYQWDRYDVIVLPPSFPFGGMENPRLTFATPTILAGDRSLNSLIAHELAHSWSGNLVTNATWDDFWLNEGFTVYFEHRISEAVYGEDFANMLGMLGYQDLGHTIATLDTSSHPEDSHLKLALNGRDPDDGMTDIAYEKGNAFLRAVESKVGRETFDAFLKNYFQEFAFTSMTTERFLTYLDKNLLEPNQVDMDVDAWVYDMGIPKGYEPPVSDRFVKVEQNISKFVEGGSASSLAADDWSTFEWMHFLRYLPATLEPDQLQDLDDTFMFTNSGNSEIVAEWLKIAIRNDYDPAYERLHDFLVTVGRRKFLTPLYRELIQTEKGRIMANAIYQDARPNYHSVSRGTIDALLEWETHTQLAI